MLENFQGDSWGSIPPLHMPSLLPHDLCHGRSSCSQQRGSAQGWNQRDLELNTDSALLSLVSLVAQLVNHLPAMKEIWVRSLGQEDPLEKVMATHSSTLAWRILWTEEPGRLESMGSQRVGHDWATSLSLYCILLIQYVPCSVYYISTTYFITESFYLVISFTYFAICLPASSL